MRQLRVWVEEDSFRSMDGVVNYRARVTALAIPQLVVGGMADWLAPPEAVRAHFALVTASDRTLKLFGTEHGQQMDYGHGDLLLGERAPDEVYPTLVQWLEQRATRRDSAAVTPPQ